MRRIDELSVVDARRTKKAFRLVGASLSRKLSFVRRREDRL
jgi:hypothetical protein